MDRNSPYLIIFTNFCQKVTTTPKHFLHFEPFPSLSQKFSVQYLVSNVYCQGLAFYGALKSGGFLSRAHKDLSPTIQYMRWKISRNRTEIKPKIYRHYFRSKWFKSIFRSVTVKIISHVLNWKISYICACFYKNFKKIIQALLNFLFLF